MPIGNGIGDMLRQKIALLVGLLIFLLLFFWMQNVGEQPAILIRGFTALVTTGLDVFTVTALVVVSGGIGRTVRLRWQLNNLNTAEAIALDSGLGLGLISAGALLLGLVGVFNAVLWAALLVIAGLLRRAIHGWLQSARALFAAALRPQTGWERFIVVVTGVLLALALLLAFAPPYQWDAMTYHLVGPQRYVDAGRITTQPDNHFLGFPQGMEILYGLALSLFRRATTAAPLHWYVGVLALVAVGGLVRRYSDRSTALTSVLLALSSYSLWLMFGIPYVDLGVMLYGALALIAVMHWRQASQASWLLFTGVFAGLALGVKYTAGLYLIALGAVMLAQNPRRVIPHGLMFGAGVLIAFVPWLLKGGLLYANPIYPYVFDGVSWDALRATNFNSTGNGLLTGENAWHWFVLPLAATIFGREKYAPYSFTVGVWLFTLPLILLLGWQQVPERTRLLVKTAALVTLTMLGLWLLMAATSGIGAQPRLMMVGFPAVIVLGTLALHSLAQWPKTPLNVSFLVHALLSFTVLLNGFNVAHDLTRANLPQYYVAQDVEGFLWHNLGNYYGAMKHLETLPAGSTVQFMWEPKSFYCPPTITCVPDVLFDNWWRPLRLGRAPDELMQDWREEGVDYVLVIGLTKGSSVGYDFWRHEQTNVRAENDQFPAALEQYMESGWTDNVYSLYRWKD